MAAETVEVAPGERYRAGWLSRVFFGAQWRDLWATRLQVPVLDLGEFDGGLAPTRRGGGLQTKNLHLDSKNGREWVFRSVDKDATGMLDEETRKSILADILQDLTSTSHPVGALVVAPLLETAGVLHATPQLMAMPDDPRLGEFRKSFAGVLGIMEERQPEVPGQQRVMTTLKLFRRLERHNDERVDGRDYLRARLMDVFVGDWDRHVDQWRWVRFEEDGERVWRPMPRDRDQAFCRFDGIVPSIAEYYTKQLASFGEKYPSLEKLTYSGRFSDRRFLVGLDWAQWEEIAAGLAAKLTDAAIDDAVNHLPPEALKANAQLAAILRMRRDHLHEAAREYYLVLAQEVDVRGADPADVARVVSAANGSVSVSVQAADDQQPYYQRRFLPSETGEIRLYMPGGKTRVRLAGDPSISVRVVEPRDEEVRDRFADPSGAADPPEDTLQRRYEPTRDWGSDWLFFPQLAFDSSRGLVAGARALRTGYGFELVPFASQMNFSAAWATGLNQPRLEYRADFRMRAPVHAVVYLLYSGIDTVNFFGLGNESLRDPLRDYGVPQDQLLIHPLLEVALAGPLRTQLGLTVKRVSNDEQAPAAAAYPYGFGAMALASIDAGLTLDSRTGSLTEERGFRLHFVARHFPRLFDAQSAFTKLRGEASALVGGHLLTDVLLGVRVAGERNIGKYPFFEAAFIGGAAAASALDITGLTSGNLLRGYDLNRFAGDSSLIGNTELRIALGRYTAVLPFRYGIVGLADLGRVFVAGQPSSRWHTGAGGGLWLAVAAAGAAFNLVSTLSAVMVRSDERTTFYFAGGFGL